MDAKVWKTFRALRALMVEMGFNPDFTRDIRAGVSVLADGKRFIEALQYHSKSVLRALEEVPVPSADVVDALAHELSNSDFSEAAPSHQVSAD
jgi:hypothetical protein